MLDEQFFSSSKFSEFINKSFVAILATSGQQIGTELGKVYGIRATPTVVIAEVDGSEIERIVGYSAPPENFLKKIENAYNRLDTFGKLKEMHEKDPDNLEVTFKLAYKYERNYIDPNIGKKLYQEIIDRGDEAKNVMVPYEATDEMVSVYEYSMYRLSYSDPAGLVEFVDKFPESKLINESVYLRVASSMTRSGSSEKAESFFDKVIEKYPENTTLMNYFVTYCINTESNIDKGIEVAEKIFNKDRGLNSLYHNNYAKILALKGDTEKLNQVYGENFIKSRISDLTRTLSDYATFWEERNENLESAEKILELAIELEPENYRTRATVASKYVEKGRIDDALRIYGPEYLEIAKNGREIELLMYVSFWTVQNENLESALEAAKLNSVKSNTPRGYQLVARVYLMMDKEEEALKVYGADYIKNNMTNISALNSYANFWATVGKNLESVEEVIEHLLTLDPGTSSNRRTLARTCVLLDRIDNALQVFGPEYGAQENLSESNLYVYASFWAEQGTNLESALAAALRFKEIGEKSESPYGRGESSLLARIYTKMGKIGEALKEYGPEYIAKENIEDYELFSYASFWAEEGTNLESALDAALQAKEYFKGQGGSIATMANQTLAKIYSHMDRMEEALKEYGPEFIKDHLKNANTLNSYALFWAQEGKNLDHALEISKKSIALKSDMSNWAVLSLVYLRMGKYEQATEAEKKALEYPQPYSGYLKYIEDIKKDIKKTESKK